MTDSSSENNERASNADDVGRLINYAGAREEVRSDSMDKARERVAAHWEQVVAAHQTKQRQQRLRMVSMAAGVTMVAITSLLYVLSTSPPQTLTVASVDGVLGAVELDNIALGHGDTLAANTFIQTGPDSRIALRMAGGQSLRMDTSSQLIVHSSDHVSLQAGAIYIDTDAAVDLTPMLVSTHMGNAKDIGTRFQVRLADSTMIVSVREGTVEIDQSGRTSLSINEGFFVELGASGQKMEQPLPTADPRWFWIETVLPAFDIEDASLQQYLIWYAHERGVSLKWEDVASERNAGIVKLSGSIAGASLSESLEIVQGIAHFVIRIEGESIWVKVGE